MTALKEYARDRDLLVRLGDEDLRLPEDHEMVSLVREHLCTASAPKPIAARWVFARWKPATSVLGCWTVSFDDETERLVSLKRYSGPKADLVGASFRDNEHMQKAAAPLIPFAHIAASGALLTSFPVDRVLRGAARVLDLRRTGRALDDAGLWPGKVFRRRSSRIELLRYKPERRAVLSLQAELKVREEGGARAAGSRRLGVRVLEADEARRIVERRESIPAGILPGLLHTELETGLLFEEWVDGEPVGSEDFSQAAASAAALSRLHAEGIESEGHRRRRSGAAELLGRVPELERAAAAIESVGELPTTCWVHGDFHPDQLTRTEDGFRLLDADALRPGTPEEDFSSWIADHVAHDSRVTLQEASAPLFEGYGAAAVSLDLELIRGLVAEELIARAAAGLRRLQEDAEKRASNLIERAVRIVQESLTR